MLIEQNGGKAEGLDLSGKWFEEDIDLSKLDLQKIILRRVEFVSYFTEKIWEGGHLEEADLTGAHLEEADFFRAHLEGVNLSFTNLDGARFTDTYLMWADLEAANLKGADLTRAYLSAAILTDAELSSDTRLENVYWGNYILGEEMKGNFDWAADTYRRLKQWYTNAGIYDVAGEFFYREMETKRKAMKWYPDPFPRVWSTFLALLVGYGERPLRVLASAMAAFLSLTAIYWLLGGLTLSYSLYFSAISFTALGYGNWVKDVDITGWMQGVGAFESFIGILMIVLFSITFTRKMTR